MENASKKKKPDPKLIEDLWSENELLVLKTIHGLRATGNIHYIPELLKLLHQTRSETVEKELVRFIADVKEAAIVPYIIAGLKDPDLASAHGDIVSACWQSGLDYSQELDLFILLFIEGDYRTALESFTVIEESVVNLNGQDIEKAQNLLLKGLEQVSEEKKPLARELVKLLQV